MLDAQGTLKLTDFGFAACSAPSRCAARPPTWRPRSCCSVDGKAVDFWATGCVLYELLHGKSPFGAPTANAAYALILKNSVDYPDSLPEDASDLIFQMLQKALEADCNMAGGFQDIKDHPFPWGSTGSTQPAPHRCRHPPV